MSDVRRQCQIDDAELGKLGQLQGPNLFGRQL
jgi:hypothetical protein